MIDSVVIRNMPSVSIMRVGGDTETRLISAVPGSKMISGDQGPRGLKGDKGDQGPPGDLTQIDQLTLDGGNF